MLLYITNIITSTSEKQLMFQAKVSPGKER